MKHCLATSTRRQLLLISLLSRLYGVTGLSNLHNTLTSFYLKYVVLCMSLQCTLLHALTKEIGGGFIRLCRQQTGSRRTAAAAKHKCC